MARSKVLSLSELEKKKLDIEEQIKRERIALAEKFGKPFVVNLGDSVTVQQLTEIAKAIKVKGVTASLAVLK